MKKASIIIEHVESLLKKNAFTKIAVGVSGGPDSIALLYAFYVLKSNYDFDLQAVTINHNLRLPQESKRDADFVEDFCKKIAVPCWTYTAQLDEICLAAKKRKRGLEDAARNIRYKFFADFMHCSACEILCLAHTRDDQLETLLLRFLQGSSSSGIHYKRDYIVRPLLEVRKTDILAFLAENNVHFVVDSSNNHNNFLRNKIRNKLVPILNDSFTGWDTAVLHGAQKTLYLETIIKNMENDLPLQKMGNHIIKIEKEVFFANPLPVRLELLKKSLKLLHHPHRVSFSVLQEIANGKEKNQCKDLLIELKGNNVVLFSGTSSAMQDFFITVEHEQIICHQDFTLEVKFIENNADDGAILLPKVQFPFIVRNIKSVDTILCANGKPRLIRKIFSDWKTSLYEKNAIPVIEYSNQIYAIIGAFYEKPNWIVKEKNITYPCMSLRIQ